ncbi:MRVI1 [Branchiostoma lanceolatum]|uniref:MRVI1 protein n=1 Tax=Branchiostoma lanceolatum TaxID=7740 RepID=A0A8K0A0F7_BRALA|nr:MRVI1 [Branchiostoma lanceolatum]
MSYLYDPVLDIYYRPPEDDQHVEDVALSDDDIKNDHADWSKSYSDDCSPVSTTCPSANVDTCSPDPSILGCSTGSQGFRPPDSSSLVSKLADSNSCGLGFSPPDTKPNSLDSSRLAEGSPSSLGCRTSLQDRLGLMSKMRMTNSFSIQEEEEEEEDGCEEDIELFPGVGRGPLPVLREESMEMSSDAEENHFIPVVHEPSSEMSPASSEDEEEPLDLPRRGSLLQPRDDTQASRSKSAEFIGEMRRGSSGFLTRPKVHRRSDPIKKASLQELRKISFCRGGRPILSFSEEGVVDLLYGSLDEVELTEEDRKRNLELLEECRIASERFKNRPRPYKFKKAGKTERERPESPTRQETAEESGHLADKESSLETPPEEEEEEKEEQKLKKRSSTRSLRSNSTDSDIDVKADILRGLNSTFPQTKPAGGGYQDFPIKPLGKGGGYKDFPLPKAQGGYRDFPLVKVSGGSGGYQDFPLRPIPGPPGETPTPPQKALREQGRGAEENKVRFGNTAAISSRLPELAEASETESKQDEDSDRSSPSSSPEDHTEVVSRSMPESVLRNLGLATSQPQRCLTEEEVENRFTALALEWRTDSYTLEKRCLLLERQRDVAEKNLDQEMGMLRGSLVGLNHLVKDRETHELMRELHQQMDIIHHLNIKVSIKSEMHGSVQQEWRVSRAIEVMMQHVENLKRLYEREHSELEEMRRLIQDTGVFDRFALPTRSSDSGDDSATHGPIRVRRASVAISPGMNKDTAGGMRRPPMASRGSVFGPNGTSTQGSMDDSSSTDKIKGSAAVKEAVRRFSVGRLMELAMATKRPDKKNSDGEKTEKLDKEKEEEIFQKGFEQGLRAQVSKTLLELREQQKELTDSVELLLEEEEEERSSERENTFISSMYETITAQFLPGWRRKQHIWRLVVTGIICMAALLSVIYAFLPSRRGVNRFTALALEWRTDSYTLEKRCLLLERQRDVAEKNLDQEMGMLRGSLVGLNHLVKDRETHELMRELHQQMDIIHHLNIKVSIKSEMHGSVQQEWRVSRAIEVMMQHVENLKRLYEREHSELEEMRRLIQDTGVFDRFALPTRSSDSGDDSATTGPIRVRRASVAISPGMNKGVRRRASVAAIPRSIAMGLGGPPSPDTAGGMRRPPMASRGSVFGPNGTSTQGSMDDSSAADKIKGSAAVKEAVRRFSVGRLMELAMATKRPDKKNSDGEKTEKLDKEKEEEIFQKGFEQGLRAQVSKTLLELREQQKELTDSVELLLEEEEEERSSERENSTFISSMYETITAKFLPGWRRKQHIWRLVVTGIICMAALLSVIYAFLPSRRGVVEENMS